MPSRSSRAATRRDLFDLEGRVAVVTGAASGLGQAIGAGLAQAGAMLALLDVNEAGPRRRPRTFIDEEGGERDLPFVCDVTSSAAVNEAADAVVRAARARRTCW